MDNNSESVAERGPLHMYHDEQPLSVLRSNVFKDRVPSPMILTLPRFAWISRRRSWTAITLLFAVSSVTMLLHFGSSLNFGDIASIAGAPGGTRLRLDTFVHEDWVPDHLSAENYLAGPPTVHMRDSLRNDTQYLTSWLSAGFTNDVITVGNLVYLALLTSRVPVIPPFTSHIGGNAIPVAFSQIFDVPRLVRALRTPVLEWHQVKDVELAESIGAVDELGCWSIWEVDDMHSGAPRGSYSTRVLNIDISYTRAPSWVKLMPGFEHDMHSTFWSLAKLAFPEARTAALADRAAHPTRPTERSGVVLPPDDQLLCYDYLYYVCGHSSFDFESDYSPAWRFVMQHFRWTPRLEEHARGYLRRTIGVPAGAAIPPYIAVHARHGDFADWCGDVPRDECFAPLSAFARRVREVQQELRAVRGVEAVHVVMTSDEGDEGWWGAVAALGWLRVDYARERTVELYGKWYPVIIDAVIQSGGIGFVGTDRSTFSTLARRRVEDWNDGVVRTVMWGRPDSDAH